jgi:Spy/CpxP family protein refolding chaperone
MRKIRGLLTIGAILMAMTTAAQAGAGPRGPMHRAGAVRQAREGRGGPYHKVFAKLNLTDQQKDQIKGILDSNREGITQAREARHSALKAYREAVKTGEEAGIRAAGAKLGTATADVGVIRAKVWTSIKAVLTPEQLQKLENMKDRAKNAMAYGPRARMERPGRAGWARPGLD